MAFKVGDIITVKDDPNDYAVKNGIKGYYEVKEVHPDGYSVYSLKNKSSHSIEFLRGALETLKADYNRMSEQDRAKFPCHMGQHKNIKEAFDAAYRLATPEEILLYVKK